MRSVLVVVILGLLPGCPPTPVPPPTGEYCQGAYQRLLACEGKGQEGLLVRTRKGETYEQVCLRVEKEGGVPTNAKCIVDALTCEEVFQCQQ